MNYNSIRLDVEADGYTVHLFEPPYLYVNTVETIETWVLREPGEGCNNTHWGDSEFEFCSSVSVTQCPPALAAGGQHSPLTRKQVMRERRAYYE